MGAILSFLGSAVGRLFADKVVGWIALKLLLVALFTLLVPIILNNFVYDIMEIVMNFANGQAGGAGTMNGAMNFTGFAAWLIACFKLPEALSVLVSALVLRLTLSMIPMVKL